MRALFGGDLMLRSVSGTARFNTSTLTLTFYDAATGGTQVTDLLAADGVTAATTVEVTGSTVPAFYGPDGVVKLWADAGDGSRELMRGSYETAGADDTQVAALVNNPATATGAAVADQIAATNPFDGWVGNLTDDDLRAWELGTDPRLSIAFYGDSITQGAWGGTSELNDWPIKGLVGRFRQAIQRTHGNGGVGFVGLWRKEWVKAGTWTQIADYGPFGQCWYTTSSAATFTLTTRAGEGDNVDVFYVDTSAPFTVTIDGGAPQTITPPGGATNQTIKSNVTLPDNGAHTIVVNGPTTGTLYLIGAALYNGTSGAVVHNIGRSGSLIGDMGYSDATSNTRGQIIGVLKPRLNVVGFLANDYSSQIALATYSTRLGYLLDKTTAQGETVLWAPPDNGITPVKTITTEQYEAEMKALAVARGLPWVDIHAAWGDYTVSGDKMYDTQHPNEAGHTDIASRFLRIVRRD